MRSSKLAVICCNYIPHPDDEPKDVHTVCIYLSAEIWNRNSHQSWLWYDIDKHISQPLNECLNSQNLKIKRLNCKFSLTELFILQNHLDGIRSWQVAEDFNDFRIERNFLIALSSFTSKEKILRDIKTQQACYHYQRKLIFYSFFHWKSLPLVLKMEKVKEERKQKWRKKVLEILPDFNPSET